jgi:hypothetical protein
MYCGKEYDDAVTVCVIDRQPVVQVLPPSEGSPRHSDPSVEFLRLLFKSPNEEEFAVRCAQFLARIVGNRVSLLRPDTTLAEIIEWSGRSIDGLLLAIVLEREFGVDLKEILANPEFTTFRDLVEHVCAREDKTA